MPIFRSTGATRDTMAGMPNDFSPGALKLELQRLSVLTLPRREYLTFADIDVARVGRLLDSVQAQQPQDFASLLSLQGVGAKTARAMSFIADIVHGAPASFRDPETYSFAHGGKDGHPFPVDRALYDTSIQFPVGRDTPCATRHAEEAGCLFAVPNRNRRLPRGGNVTPDGPPVASRPAICRQSHSQRDGKSPQGSNTDRRDIH